ncbi:glutamate:Na+ symporter, ESS family [Intestinibacter bartlettii DSM 16795]|jgi:ESS family glutamate:Na+ symporter|uniref:sodium/glutamate symporter n=1 Tax=Intestinibacter bartlettii TaxID=261299 RepID=UPI0001631740|nr:sodium/glutamate symporter [Intestinibacter bartlettii]EDQ96284.1 putative sodium/glutamate symporter [Intestinibacter bartlettii DSM 16795]MCC2705547.1 sodium:glutamate symporter [Intestinibacter bartlettii]MCC2760997.1 sodium:glutamate symporter [Intestinibacter bartlettii]MDU6471957.1 sodium/glutamate symporter [Intestinibacter bartlettii]UWO79722.1 sodium:glutamate symporter [Intestinibacter bartlettii]
MINLDLNIVSTLILAIVLCLFGNFIKNKFSIFNKVCIPTPVIGGLFFSLLIFILRKFGVLEITMDTSLMPYFLSIFFISVGFCINIFSAKGGGKLLFLYWLLCAFLGLFQNLIAVFSSKLLHIKPLLGFMCGSVSMEGGHGYALAFGKTIESIGIENACAIGIAAATLGLITGGLLGGPVGRFLIYKYDLKPLKGGSRLFKNNKNQNTIKTNKPKFQFTPIVFLENILILLLIMNISFFVSNIIYIKTNILIPNIVIGMLLSVIINNFNIKKQVFDFSWDLFDFIQNISLDIFLTMALMSIDLYALSSLLGPILIIVFFQVLFVLIYGVFICFRVLGKDYDAAIMISGLIGHTLGATPNALANMSTLTSKYGKSETAFLIVPMVGAFLLDAFSMPCILFFINFLK